MFVNSVNTSFVTGFIHGPIYPSRVQDQWLFLLFFYQFLPTFYCGPVDAPREACFGDQRRLNGMVFRRGGGPGCSLV